MVERPALAGATGDPLQAVVRHFFEFEVSMTIFSLENSAMLSGICPLCLGVTLVPRSTPQFLCPLCLGSGKINVTEKNLRKSGKGF